MVEIRRTPQYDAWFDGLRDRAGKARIVQRVFRLQMGNPGQHRALTKGVCELKIDFGPGYRVYYQQRGDVLILLLCGGDKSAQSKDIAEAKRIAKEWKDENPED